jgi:hypothetical protein
MWPAFWAEVRGKEITPLKPDQVLAAAGDLLFPEKSATRILTALYDVVGPEGTPALVMSGKAFEMNVDGGLDASPFKEGKKGREYYWAVKKDGKYSPLIPDFNPANQEAAAEPEARIQKILEALAADPAPGRPVLAYKSFLYQLIDNNLDKSESKSTAAPAPQFFRLKDGKTHPVIPDEEKRMIIALAGTDQTLTEEQVALVLKALGEKEHAYVSGGKLFRLNDKGKLEARDDDAAAPVAWPLAHQVRPARQALGVNGCTDCHSSGSDFFFGKVKGAGPLRTENVAVRRASSFMGVGGLYHRLFGLSFTVRPVFKVVLFICAFVIGALLLIVFLIALGRLAGLIEKRK